MARRRQRGEGSVYQRPSGGWAGQINLGVIDGKRRRRTVYAPTQREVVREMTRLRREAEQTGAMPTATMTLTKWLTYWLDEVAGPRVKPATLATYRSHVREHITPAIGHHRLDKLEAHHVRAMHTAVSAKGLSSTTAMHAHRILTAALNDAVREQRVGRNVASLVRSPRKAVSDRRGLTVAEARAVLTAAAAADERMASRWLAALLLGTRQGETIGLRWPQVHLADGVIELAWSLQRVPYSHGCAPACGRRPDRCPQRVLAIPAGLRHQVLDGNQVLIPPKSASSIRTLPIPAPLLAALHVRAEQVDSERQHYAVDHDLVWCRPDGRPLDSRADWREWKSLLAAAGVPDLTLHETRHTTATLLHEARVPAATAAAILGHSDITVTRAYTHVDLTLAGAALTELGETLTGEVV